MENTTYVVFELATFSGKPGRVYLAGSSGRCYSWAGRHISKAARFEGREAAERVAEELDAAIRANGFTPRGIRIVAASGGPVASWRAKGEKEGDS